MDLRVFVSLWRNSSLAYVAGLIERYNNPPREDAGDSADDDAGDETDEPLLPTMTPELDAVNLRRPASRSARAFHSA